MNKILRLYYLASVVACALFFIVAGVLYWHYSADAQVNINNVVGWAYSGNTGWISLNSQNCVSINNPAVCTVANPPVQYGLKITLNDDLTAGTLNGYAWSTNLGWICFGTTCAATTPDNTAADAIFECLDSAGDPVTCDLANNERANITGWARILSLPGSEGWMRLNAVDAGVVDYGLYIDFSNPDSIFLSGYGWHYAGGADSDASYGIGWVQFAQGPEILFPYLHAEGGDVFAKRISTFFPPPSGKYNAQYLVHVLDSAAGSLSTRFTSQCTQAAGGSAAVCEKSDYQLDVTVDQSTERPLNFKLGRFDFLGLSKPVATVSGNTVNKYDDIVTTTNAIATGGDVVLGGKVYVSSPLSGLTINNPVRFKNAPLNGNGTGTIIVKGDLIINADISYFPAAINDRRELASVAWLVLGDVKIAPTVKEVAGTFIVLGGLGDAIVDSRLECSVAGSCVGQKLGAVCGSVGKCVPKQVYYCSTGTKLNYECATNLVCGTGGLCSINDTGIATIDKERNYCNTRDNQTGDLHDNCGKFISCQNPDPISNPQACSTSDITISGSVFARQFKLGRTYVDIISKDPAEKFISDGRIQLNPPPGMSDFAKGLPSFGR